MARAEQPPAGRAASTGQLVVAGHLEPPFSRHHVDRGLMVDSGRYGKYCIGHGSMVGHWNRSTPRWEGAPDTARSNVSGAGNYVPGTSAAMNDTLGHRDLRASK